MGLTISRKTAKNSAVRRKNEKKFTVSLKKIEAQNKVLRSLLSLMCYMFICSGSENYDRNRKCRKCLHNLSHGCRCASWQTFWQLYYYTTFFFLLCWPDGCIESDSESLSRWRREAYRRHKTGVKVTEENKLFSSFQKDIIEFLGLNEQAQKFGLASFDLKFYRLTKINCKAENYELELPF